MDVLYSKRDNDFWKNETNVKKLIRKSIKWLFAVPLEFLLVISVKLAATVMVLRVISNKGDALIQHISPKGLRGNTEVNKAVVNRAL